MELTFRFFSRYHHFISSTYHGDMKSSPDAFLTWGLVSQGSDESMTRQDTLGLNYLPSFFQPLVWTMKGHSDAIRDVQDPHDITGQGGITELHNKAEIRDVVISGDFLAVSFVQKLQAHVAVYKIQDQGIISNASHHYSQLSTPDLIATNNAGLKAQDDAAGE
jgi:hypothetical protein